MSERKESKEAPEFLLNSWSKKDEYLQRLEFLVGEDLIYGMDIMSAAAFMKECIDEKNSSALRAIAQGRDADSIDWSEEAPYWIKDHYEPILFEGFLVRVFSEFEWAYGEALTIFHELDPEKNKLPQGIKNWIELDKKLALFPFREELSDLFKIRHIIVHKNGFDYKEVLERLSKASPDLNPDLTLPRLEIDFTLLEFCLGKLREIHQERKDTLRRILELMKKMPKEAFHSPLDEIRRGLNAP